jgi:hypothetical protein
VIALAVSIIGGISVYFVMQYVLIPKSISIPLSIIISALIYALTMYYSQSSNRENYNDLHLKSKDNNEIIESEKQFSAKELSKSFILFVFIYATAITICAFSNPEFLIYKNWNEISVIEIIQLGTSIMLTFFLPGYAILLIMTIADRLRPLLRIIAAYLFSILITGLSTYILAVFYGAQETQIKDFLLTLNVIIIVILLVSRFSKIRNKVNIAYISHNIFTRKNIPLSEIQSILSSLKAKNYEILAFGSLFALLIISTYYLYGGITIGDQWFHQGRSMMILSGSFEQVAASGLDSDYYPFQPALIAGLTSLSGVPLVNTFASTAFLNIVPLFSFYYFYSRWIPQKMQRANLLASSLFVICSGFGWIYLISLVTTTGAPISEHSTIETISSIRSYILMPSNFIIASHPDFSTALIFITIPAGLVLLGLIRQILQSRIIFTIILTVITVLGILSHEEFYLFIIVASIVPILFRIKQGQYVYLAFIFAFSIVYAINIISPQNYYNYTEVFGHPLLTISIIFVPVMWIIYLATQKLGKILGLLPKKVLNPPSISFDFIRKFVERDTKARYIMPLIIIVPVTLLYVTSFAFVALVPPSDANDEALQGKVSWYQYPMKLGLAGLLGLAFILSYFFKRFEKEIFIFGIIIVIAILTGPYYDEHRFSKYVMLGIIPLASLFIYKILDMRFKSKPIINGIIIMIIVITGSLSTLLFVGYNSLAFQNHDYLHDLGRRNFPSESEFHLMEALRNSTDISSGRYNVISTPGEYNFYKGTLLTKLSTFGGFPTGKLLQGRFVLNVTNLDSLFRLLDYTNTKFIVIPKESVKQQETKLSEAVRFAVNHFLHYYENEKYLVLDVPPLSSPSSSKSEVALVYNGNQYSVPESKLNNTLLQYNNKTYNSIQLNQLKNQSKSLQADHDKFQNTIVCSPKRNEGLTVWSKGFDDIVGQKINYVETAFKLLDSHDNNGWSDTGLRWKEGNKEYYASISKNGLEFYQKIVGDAGKGEKDKKLLYQNSEVSGKENVWYNLKLESLRDTVNVYIDNALKVKLPRPPSDNSSGNISSVGISCFNDDTEFKPITVGKITSQNLNTDEIKNNYERYYPFSSLALSKSQYDTFLDTDFSALSKKIIILSSDPLDWDNIGFNYYMQYVKEGGTLVVINSDGNFKGRFSELFSIQYNVNATGSNFTSIEGRGGEIPGISGTVRNISNYQSSNASILASYVDNNDSSTSRPVAPFALERQYPNGGKIILVNAGGYFDAVAKSPAQYYGTLSSVFSILGLHPPKASSTNLTTMSIEPLLGPLYTAGDVILKSNSLLLSENFNQTNQNDYVGGQNYNISTQGIKIYEDKKLKSTLNDVFIKAFNLNGDYKVTINSKDVKLPYITSQQDYLGILMPKFNMTINLSNKSVPSSQLVIQNQKNQTVDTITLNKGSEIRFDNIHGMIPVNNSDSALKPANLPILLKSPEVELKGDAKFKILRFWWHYLERVPIEIHGQKTRFNFIDDYTEPYGNGTKVGYLTFMSNDTWDN